MALGQAADHVAVTLQDLDWEGLVRIIRIQISRICKVTIQDLGWDWVKVR